MTEKGSSMIIAVEATIREVERLQAESIAAIVRTESCTMVNALLSEAADVEGNGDPQLAAHHRARAKGIIEFRRALVGDDAWAREALKKIDE